jgi:cytochrome c-type biogenesis protein CcmE
VSIALRWGLPAAVVAACVGYLIYSASGGTSVYYVTVSQLRAQSPAGEVRVAGVVENDVQKTDGGMHVTFTEKEGADTLPVEYTGTLPDIFQPGITVVAEGRLGRDGVFHATTLLAKCPSRFSTKPYTS